MVKTIEFFLVVLLHQFETPLPTQKKKKTKNKKTS